jgi:hypothetical protein
VEGLVSDLADVVKTRIKQTFDMARLAKDANAKGQCVRPIMDHVLILRRAGELAEPHVQIASSN